MLGYTSGQPTIESQFGLVNGTFAMDDVQCQGNETSFLDCPHFTVDNCDGTEAAGVICDDGEIQIWCIHPLKTHKTP